jgi:uncharacterized protein YegJ (DUF2314 family)
MDRRALFAIAGGAVAAASHAVAQEPTFVKRGDRAMDTAIRQARAALPRFLKRLDNPQPGDTGFEVKVLVAGPNPGIGVYIWLKDVKREGKRAAGIAYTVPAGTPTPQNGQRVLFSWSRVDDWIITSNGKMQGGYTVRALLPQMEPADAARMRERLGPL